jgi:hypothetical protein
VLSHTKPVGESTNTMQMLERCKLQVGMVLMIVAKHTGIDNVTRTSCWSRFRVVDSVPATTTAMFIVVSRSFVSTCCPEFGISRLPKCVRRNNL